MNMFKNFLRDESGASAAEYAIIIAIIGAALVTAMGYLGTALEGNATKSALIINPA
jgi:pilus assembly protein Flp/PilA